MDDYDRRTVSSGTPVNRINEGENYLHQAGRDLEKSEAIIRGLYSELLMVVRSTHDKHQRNNFDYVTELKERTEKMIKDLKVLAQAYNEAAREFR